MYLNLTGVPAIPVVVSLEPTHEMYLNSFLLLPWSHLCFLEPTHEMYLNWSEIQLGR